MDLLPERPPRAVLSHFAPHTDGLTWHRAPAGFSGAQIWRGDAPDGTPKLAVKAWPPGTTLDRLHQIHEWTARAAHLAFVPKAYGAVEAAGLWDCGTWVPGAPRPAPTAAEVACACAAVARLHDAWAADAQRGPCPGVRNRLRIFADSAALLRAGPGALPSVSPLLDPLLARAVALVARAAPDAVRALELWADVPLVLQPCVRDLRADHVLFVGATVSGIIDFGAAAVDHPVVDLARLLGDFDAHFDVGLAAYRAARPAFDAPDELVRLLARVGPVCSALGWVVRLVVRREATPDPPRIAARLDHLLDRIVRTPVF